MERTDVKNNHTEEYSTGQIRCIEKSDPEYLTPSANPPF